MTKIFSNYMCFSESPNFNWSGIFFCCFLQQTGSKLIYVPYYSSETYFENSMCSRIIRSQISHTSATSAQRNSSKKSTSQITKLDFINWKKKICALNVVRCFWLMEHWKNIWKLNILTLKFMSVIFVRKSSKERTN